MKPSSVQRTSDIMHEIIEKGRAEDTITIGRFVSGLGDRAFGIAILLFALPNSLPLPSIPGFSTITGIPIMLFAMQMILGYPKLKLPSKISNHEFSQVKLARVLEKALVYLRKIESFLKPRLLFLSSTFGERIIGLVVVLLSLILVLPIPFGNFLPGISIAILAFGLVEKDGFTILLGFIAACLAVTIISTGLIVAIKSFILLLQSAI